MNAWDRQDGESQEAFHAFATYRDLGPRRRSHTNVADGLEVSTTIIGRWSGAHDWVNRCKFWDAHLDGIAQSEAEQQARNLVSDLVRTGEAYTTAFAIKLKNDLEALERGESLDPKTAVPINAPGFVAVGRMLVELSGGLAMLDNNGDSGTEVGHRRTATLSAEDLIAATLEVSESGKTPTKRAVILAALSQKFGADRLGALREIQGEEVKDAG